MIPAPPTRPAQPQRTGLPQRTCLIVEDSRVVRKVARSILEGLGFQCQEAEDGYRALDICLQTMPDVILLDWHMPVMDGQAFLARLRQLPTGIVPRVLVCTTVTELERIREALAIGADEYIMKPFDRDILETKLRQVGIVAGLVPVQTKA